MADFLFCKKTLESDEECEYSADDNSDVEVKNSKKKRKSKDLSKPNPTFNNEFQFDFGDGQIETWSIEDNLKKRAKGQDITWKLEEKIDDKKKELKKISKGKAKKQESAIKKDTEKINLSENDKDDVDEDDVEDVDQDTDYSDSEDEPFFAQPPPVKKHKLFSQMNLSRPLLKGLADLSFAHPTKIQSSTIPVALLGRDICACATTGSGKTAAFMLPILERLIFKAKGVPCTRVLVLVPTRELAIQVYSVSKMLSKYTNNEICLAVGGMESKKQEAALRNQPDIIIATPGRLIDHLYNAPSFDLQTIEILVLDEADRMLEEHFKDQMTELIKLCPRNRQTMLFSATMTDEVEQLASLSLNQPVKLFVDQNTDVAATLHQEFIRIKQHKENDRLPIVAALCVRTFHEHTLIFIQTKRLAHKLRIILGLLDLKVAELHGDLTQLQRIEALEKFKNNEVDILVATDLAARGLDISGVKTVISVNMPTTVKSYIHRVGRTARAGKHGRSITLVGEKERKLLKDIVKNSKVPVKNRIISSEVIERYRKKVDELEQAVKDLLKIEEEEKHMRVAEMQMNKAKNLIDHHEEIMSRPAKQYIKKDNKENKKKTEKTKNTSKKAMSEDEKNIQKLQQFQSRQMKRERKPKRIRAFDESGDNNSQHSRKGGASKKAKLLPSKSHFDRELTDTTKRNLKSMRSTASSIPAKKKLGGSFKSKKKHKRR